MSNGIDDKSKSDSIDGLKYAKEVVAQRVNLPHRFENIFKDIEIISGGNGNIVCRYTIPKNLSNTHGSLHGGIIASLVDAVSTWGLSTATKHHRHISVDLSVSYMRKAELGETITIEGKTVKLGGRVAFLTATLLDKNQKIIATGKHTKLILENKL
ncbi:acyl-coenzyme A thioesterase 13-like [Mytilus californianus]|uniref:Acyl-coenzyme A thioesterase 13 n=1 Tax=Mytilus coruscus TaxID=42192 RepID=A0A6J8CUI7_MYTCO|nr:acyl-coenzyme A thioesterase 13-like [Mytilus californianus]CAC5399077.1 ACOT13 [Mytilus coruscus]